MVGEMEGDVGKLGANEEKLLPPSEETDILSEYRPEITSEVEVPIGVDAAIELILESTDGFWKDAPMTPVSLTGLSEADFK